MLPTDIGHEVTTASVITRLPEVTTLRVSRKKVFMSFSQNVSGLVERATVVYDRLFTSEMEPQPGVMAELEPDFAMIVVKFIELKTALRCAESAAEEDEQSAASILTAESDRSPSSNALELKELTAQHEPDSLKAGLHAIAVEVEQFIESL